MCSFRQKSALHPFFESRNEWHLCYSSLMAARDKTEIFQQIIAQLEETLEVLLASAFTAKEASTNEEAKAENKYDTRGLEAAYLASGQVQRARELQEKIYNLKKFPLAKTLKDERIALSALVDLKIDDDEQKTVFLLPVGGVEVLVNGTKIQSLTPDAPLGKKLYGLSSGDEFDLKNRTYEILKIQ